MLVFQTVKAAKVEIYDKYICILFPTKTETRLVVPFPPVVDQAITSLAGDVLPNLQKKKVALTMLRGCQQQGD